MTTSIETKNVEDQLNTLTDQFNIVLSQFQTTYNEYIVLINAEVENTEDTEGTDTYAIIPNSNYWGQTGISEGSASSSEQCLANCYSKSNCSGATYDSTTNYCWIRGGNGRVAPGKENETAIIKKTILYKYQLENLNNNLININNKIMKIMNDNESLINNSSNLKKNQDDVLNYNKKMITENQIEINNLNNQYQNLKIADQNTTLMVNQSYFWYVVYLIIVLFLGVFLFSIANKSIPKSNDTTQSILNSLGANN